MGRVIRYNDIKPQPHENYRLDPSHWMAQASGLWLMNEGAGAPGNLINQQRIVNPQLWIPDGQRLAAINTTEVASLGSLITSTAYTLVARVRLSAVPGSGKFERIFTGGSRALWWEATQFGSALQMHCTIGTTNVLSAGSFVAGEWLNLAESLSVVGGNVERRGYRNGVLAASASVAGSPPALSVTLRLRSNDGGVPAIDYDHVYLFPTALTADQIAEAYATPYSGWIREWPVFYSIPTASYMANIARYYQTMRSR